MRKFGTLLTLALFFCVGISLVASAQSAADGVNVNLQVGTPTPPPAGGGGGGGQAPSGPRPEITIEQVSSGTDFVAITWSSDLLVRGEIKWGKSVDLEIGSLQLTDFKRSHEVLLTDLEANTRYFLTIKAESETGRFSYPLALQVLTQLLIQEPADEPGYVIDFSGLVERRQVFLKWLKDSLFTPVRIVRSDLSLPLDPYDGLVVYEGLTSSFTDTKVEVGKTYYYTVFPRRSDGSYGSGISAVLTVTEATATPGITLPSSGDNDDQPIIEVDLVLNEDEVSYNLHESYVVDLYQDDFIQISNNQRLIVDYHRPFKLVVREIVVNIPYEAVVIKAEAAGEPTRLFVTEKTSPTRWIGSIGELAELTEQPLKLTILGLTGNGIFQEIKSFELLPKSGLTERENSPQTEGKNWSLYVKITSLLALLIIILILQWVSKKTSD